MGGSGRLFEASALGGFKRLLVASGGFGRFLEAWGGFWRWVEVKVVLGLLTAIKNGPKIDESRG